MFIDQLCDEEIEILIMLIGRVRVAAPPHKKWAA
jgi:hypothetical protein